jgi:ribosomal protein S18 acetylase RimI-like enzyme
VPWTPEQAEHFLRSQFELQHSEYHRNYPDADYDVLLVGDVPAGRLYVGRGADSIHVLDIALLPEFRGSGIGTALLQELIDEAGASGRVVRVYVEHTNRAMTLYRRLGFEPVSDEGVYLLMERRPGAAGG